MRKYVNNNLPAEQWEKEEEEVVVADVVVFGWSRTTHNQQQVSNTSL